MEVKELKFRKMALCVPASIMSAIALIAFVVAAFSNPSVTDIPGAVIFWAFAYFFWLVGWQSAVRIDGFGVRVDNFLVRHYIPWEELADITVGNGLEFRLRDGSKVSSLMYGGSVIGRVLGYRYTQGVAARMRVARQEMMSKAHDGIRGPLAYGSHFYVAPWPPVMILAAMELVAVLALTTR